mgnify:CR=1 FL=1
MSKQLRLHPFDVKLVQCDPPEALHKNCNTPCKRRQRRTRTLITRHTDVPALLIAAVGVYHCPTCQRHWTSQPPDARPYALYAESVRNLAIDSIDEDGMPMRRVARRLGRDFGLSPHHSTPRQWWLEAAEAINTDVIEAQAISHFSGVLCLDEVYDGPFAILVATDPVQDCQVAYIVDKTIKAQHVERLVDGLARRGLSPAMVLTDDSSLYPAVLARVWPRAKHALCHFHFSMHVTDAAVEVVRQIHAKMPVPPKRKRGRPPKRGRPRKDKAKRASRRAVWKARYLVVKHWQKMDAKELVALAGAMMLAPQLTVVRQFIDEYYGLFEGCPTPHRARVRRDKFVVKWSSSQWPSLAKVARKLGDEAVWKKLVAPLSFIDAPRTTNHVEGDNRTFRKRQKAHYRLRSKRSVVGLRRVLLARSARRRTGCKLLYRFGRYAGTPVRTASTRSGG